MFDGIVTFLLIVGGLIVLLIWGAWEAVDYFFIDDAIRVETPIIPEIEITVKDNVIDTIYIYRQP